MRKYLATLHQRPHHHKKRFALAVSSGFTLSIFAIWMLVTFGAGGTLAQNNKSEIQRAHEEISPLESMRLNIAGSLESLKETFETLNNYVR